MMASGSSQAVPALVRAMHSSTGVMDAVPALVPAAKGGFLSSLFGFGGHHIAVPLSERLPGVSEPPKTSAPATKPTLQTSVVNGAKVATLQSYSPLAGVALFVEGGASAETRATAGVSKVLEIAAFKATTNRSTFRLTRELEKVGATSFARAGRDHFVFGVEAVRLNQREALEMLMDSVVNARYTYWEVRDALDAVKEQLAAQLKNPLVTVSEVLHRAAFDGGLGNSLVVDPAAIGGVTNDTLKEYVASLLVPSRVVLAGVGMEHADVVSLAGPLLDISGATAPAPAASKYVGGAMNVIAPSSPLTYMGLAFEAAGGAGNAKGAAGAAVLKALLDEARPTLPHARKEHDVYVSLSPFAHMYKGTGLVGVIAASAPGQAGALVDALTTKVTSLAKGVSEPQLAAAKSLALGELKASLATTGGVLSSVGSSMLATGRFSPEEVAAAISGMTAQDATAYVAGLLKSPPTFVAYGNLGSLPRIDTLAKRFA
jgi:processing peptidase subunit alpha